MQDIRKYTTATIYRPDMPDVKKIVSVPRRTIYINLAAAPTANIIRLEQ